MTKKKHLTKKQKAEICAKSASGVSCRSLGSEYGVAPSTIMRITRECNDFATQCNNAKKAAEEEAQKDMLEWVKQRSGTAQAIADKVLAEMRGRDFSEESIRDLAGLLKIVKDVFTPQREAEVDEGKKALDNLLAKMDGITNGK